MLRWLTDRPTGATLAVPDLVLNSNPRMPKAAKKLGRTLDRGLPRVVWLPTKQAVYIEAPCRGACGRNWSRKRPAVAHAACTADCL